MTSRVCQNGLRLLLGNCGERRAHQIEASGRQLTRQLAADAHERTHASPVDRGRHADAAGEQVAEAAETGESDFHADIGDREVGDSQQLPRAVQPRPDAELVRRLAEHRMEGSREMKRRHRGRPRDVSNRARTIGRLAQQSSGAAEAREDRSGKRHVSVCVRSRRRRPSDPSGAAESDRHLAAIADDHRNRPAPFGVPEHPLQLRRIFLDVDVLERHVPPLMILPGGLRIRSCVLAEDVDHAVHCKWTDTCPSLLCPHSVPTPSLPRPDWVPGSRPTGRARRSEFATLSRVRYAESGVDRCNSLIRRRQFEIENC